MSSPFVAGSEVNSIAELHLTVMAKTEHCRSLFPLNYFFLVHIRSLQIFLLLHLELKKYVAEFRDEYLK